MRRKEREVTDLNIIENILSEGKVLHIALNNGTFPYILPVNYGYHFNNGDMELFFHGSKEGKKHSIIEKDNHVSFEIECELAFIKPVGEEACTSSFAYASIIGQGIIEDVPEEEKERYLMELIKNYHVEDVHFNPIHLANTKMYRIRVE